MTPAEQVERGDPDRFLAVMAAPPALRPGLFTLYAVNLEIARAPWATREPMVAQMRLQFWHDVVEGENAVAGGHPLAAPLHALITAHDLPRASLHAMIAARLCDLDQRPFDRDGALFDYLRDTSGTLLAMAARVSGRPADPVALDRGTAQGLANYLLAVPALRALGRDPLPPVPVPDLARRGLELLRKPPQGPAFLADWRAGALLRKAERDPEGVASGRLGQSEFARRGSLLWRAIRA